jgi:hypothetical protein
MIPSYNGDQVDGDQVMAGSAEPDTTQAAIDRFHQILGKQDIAETTGGCLCVSSVPSVCRCMDGL